MAVFYDDFNRANGAPGANWAGGTASVAISGGFLVGSSAGIVYSANVSDSLRNEAFGHFAMANTSWPVTTLLVKWTVGGTASYGAWVGFSSPNWYFYLGKGTNGTTTVLSSESLGTVPPTYWSVRLIWDNGDLTATYNGSVTLTAYDVQYAGGDRMGVHCVTAYSRCDDFQCVGGTAPGFDVAESVVGNYGTATTLHLTGTGTAWSAGTPGTPTFTVDHGTLSGQEVLTETTATVVFDPGDYLGTVTATDPSTGLTDTFMVTSDINVLPPGDICPFDAEFVRTANNTGHLDAAEQLLTNFTIAWPGDETYPDQSVIDLLNQIWVNTWQGEGTPPGPVNLTALRNILAGAWNPVPMAYEPINVQPVKADTDQLLNAVVTLTSTYSDLLTVVELLGGTPTIYSNADIMTAIGNLTPGGDNSDVLDWLNTYLGTTGPTLAGLGQMISDLSTIAGYTLGDVLDAIAASASSLSTAISALSAKLALIQPDDGISLSSLYTQGSNLNTVLQEVKVSLQELRAPGSYVLKDILDAIAALPGQLNIPTTPQYLRPVWPGAAHVTYGAPQSIQGSLVVPGPMHGVRIHITSTDPGTGFYDYDVDRCWRNIGGLSFVSDVGDHEHWQPLGFSSAIYVPKTMSWAASCKLHLGRGPEGTITPWSYAET